MIRLFFEKSKQDHWLFYELFYNYFKKVLTFLKYSDKIELLVRMITGNYSYTITVLYAVQDLQRFRTLNPSNQCPRSIPIVECFLILFAMFIYYNCSKAHKIASTQNYIFKKVDISKV